jgi:hypothetical protein
VEYVNEAAFRLSIKLTVLRNICEYLVAKNSLLQFNAQISKPKPVGMCAAETGLGVVRFEVFTATMKNGFFWDTKTQFVLHRRHITSPLQSSAS